jgi:SAM-dependent methyltransferase
MPEDILRLNWGCGPTGEPGWVNSDIKSGPHVDLVCDIRDGLPLPNDSVDYAVSVHALPELPLSDLGLALRELRRVLKRGAPLRLVLPDLCKGVEAYSRGDRAYFMIPDDDAGLLGSKLIIQLLWYGYVRTLFVPDFIEEELLKSGYREVRHVAYRKTASRYPEIVELDNREAESLFVEALK